MDAAILAVGSELLRGDRVDTNSVRVAAALRQHGVATVVQQVVGDDEELLEREVGRWAAEVPLVVIGGGLGPTVDDRTRPAVARALGRELVRRTDLVASLRERARKRGSVLTEAAEQQADVVHGAEVLRNPNGSAPGQRIETASSTVFLLPGVPRELETMLQADVLPWVEARTGLAAAEGPTVFRVADVGESTLDQALRPLWETFDRSHVIVLAAPGEVEIRVEQGDSDLAKAVRAVLGDEVHSEGERGLAGAVGALLGQRGEILATAESCTGGLVGAELTDVPGSSGWYTGGVVSYSNGLKRELLGVSEETLRDHGAVSSEVAAEMAVGARRRLGADRALAVTGVAGPGGGTPEKPVGTVWFGLDGPNGVTTFERRFPGDRAGIRRRSVIAVLERLRRSMLRESRG